MSKKSRRVAKARRVLLSLSLVLVMMMVAVGGTIAWLTDETTEIVNTFTYGDVDIELDETEDTNKDRAEEFDVIPGVDITKTPYVTVKAASEKCYVFVTVTEENWPTWTVEGSDPVVRKLDYKIKSGWELVDTNGDTKVYGQLVNDIDADQVFYILDGDKVTVDSTMTKTEIDELENTNKPKLTFQAYAIQYDGLTNANDEAVNTVAAAWELVEAN